MTLENFNIRFEEELGKISSIQETKDKKLDLKYLSALLRLETTSRTEGDLELVQATRKEISRIEQGQVLINDGSPVPPELKEMQRVITNLHINNRQQAATATVNLVDNLKSYAATRSIEATRQDNISVAVAWKEWEDGLNENEQVGAAYSSMGGEIDRAVASEEKSTGEFHEALRGTPANIQFDKAKEFSETPKIYVQGSEPIGKEKRMQRATTPNAKGSGHTIIRGELILIDEDDTISNSRYYGSQWKEETHLYVPRLKFSPLIGKTIDRTLVVFDLYKRGTGSKRSIIRTDTLLLPPLTSDDKVVIDAGIYAYETQEYDSRWSSYDYKNSTADEFYGYIVTLFDRDGELIYQRTTERALKDHARETPPR